jgi:soluble lytic murein transglycosylase-like protein
MLLPVRQPARSRLADCFRILALAALLVMPALCTRAGAEQQPDSRDPYLAASQDTGVPLALLAAIAGAESAYHPWALNRDGKQIYCHSRAEAEMIMADDLENIDIGLMQINYRLWGHRLGLSKAQLLDPRVNLLVGARILKESLNRSGDLWARIGSYHSSRPDERQRYNQEVYKSYLRYLRYEPRQ